MRLAAQAKGGFYPTPPRVVDLIADLINTTAGAYHRGRNTLRILDPCCGAGEALAQLAERLDRPNAISHRDLRRGAAPGQSARRPRSGSTTPWPRTSSPRP